ncbi:MAG: DNA (cytosine-5-)-methyltransferase [Actinobacteria bacterium HGW-Actinobacteria-10]|nr:MAG: DNA (cytosine-5-)-methyltransferase [Actinobacteria bacterium HGW-Actinobacteria-10]
MTEACPALASELVGLTLVPVRKPITVTSFFAGCGGMDLGFLGDFQFLGEKTEKLPFEVIESFDYDAKAVATYRANIDQRIEIRDLADPRVDEMKGADVLIGGFPCQDFSSCGPKRGLTSERGQLYRALVSYMRTHQPMVVVAENVPHLERIHGGEALVQIMADFQAAGYRFEKWRLFAPDYGVPQNRTRIFLVGVRKDITGHPVKPSPTHIGSHRSIEWAIRDLEPVVDESVANQSQYFLASKAKNGNGQGDEVSRADEPAYTVRANAKSRVQFHYKLPRRLTVRECARLQTFPDDFIFVHSATTNIMQIGNAVPPLLAHHVARSVATFVESAQD